MNLISLLNRAFKEPRDTPSALVATTSIANTYRSAGERGGKIAAKEGRKEDD